MTIDNRKETEQLDILADSCWEEHNGLNTFNHVKFAALVAAHARETHRLPKMTEDQIWKCNNDGDGGVHICIEHQNVVDFARAIEREIGFARAELMLTRIKAAVAAEREACAKVCDDMGKTMADRDGEITEWCAAAIRARGETPVVSKDIPYAQLRASFDRTDR